MTVEYQSHQFYLLKCPFKQRKTFLSRRRRRGLAKPLISEFKIERKRSDGAKEKKGIDF